MSKIDEKEKYQLPSEEIVKLVDAEATPYIYLNPQRDWLLIREVQPLPSIEVLAEPELKLAGIRFNPRNFGKSRGLHFNNLKLMTIDGSKEYQIKGLPKNCKISSTSWSPDGRKIAFLIYRRKGLELWIASVETKRAKKIISEKINSTLPGGSFEWMSDSNRLLVKLLPEDMGKPPVKSSVPQGPVIRESLGETAPVRTYQDLLKDEDDMDIFEYYITSQLALVTIDGEVQKLGIPSMIWGFDPSPDNKYILMETIHRPFSLLVPYSRFPYSVEIWTIDGKLFKNIADIPVSEKLPKGFGAVRTGPRYYSWREDVDSTLKWVEALDDGDPSTKVKFRDEVFLMDKPFDGKKRSLYKCELRYGGIKWGNGELATIDEWWWKNRKIKTIMISPDNSEKKPIILFDRSMEDKYNDPGDFQMAYNKYGRKVLDISKDEKYLYLMGEGASSEGDRPFYDKFNLKTLKSERIWRSKAPYYENPIVLFDDNSKLFYSRESEEEPPNYYILELKSGKNKKVTNFPHPYPTFKNIKKEIIKYKRKDGVDLTGDLYLPKGYKKGDGTLPVLLWAYPHEFKDAKKAGQVKGSPHKFTRLHPHSPLYFLALGYAILDGPSMPIIGEGDKEPNDTYIEQLVSNAQAAIDKLKNLGISDGKHIAIGGHSYGAFMVANLLAHSTLFTAGIARSGAYNRTLTPFGFQSEERTIWEAPDVYMKMSPFMYADKIKEPILLIHGAADNNSGTFPMQSKRFYNALIGNGAIARYVVLPLESHGYLARESIMHMLHEMENWMDKYVK